MNKLWTILVCVLIVVAPGCAFLDDQSDAIYAKAESAMVADGIEDPTSASPEVWTPYLKAAAQELWEEKSAASAEGGVVSMGINALLGYMGVRTGLSIVTKRGLQNWANTFNPSSGVKGLLTSLSANYVGTHTPPTVTANGA
jgi:hypothetical protein